MNYLTLDLDNGDLVLSDNSVWKSLNTWLDGGTLYSDYYDASNCGDFWVASTHWISIDSESTYLTFTIEYEFIDATATDSCLCQIKFDGFEDGGVAVTADSSGLNISTDASKHINCDYSNANIKIDITVNFLTKEITTYIHKDNEPLAKKVNVSNYSFTEFVIQAGSRGDIVYKLPTTTKLLNVSVSDVAVSYSNFPETIDYIDKLGLARIWANIKSYISSQLLGKSDTGHTHVSSDVTDLLSDTHTWTSQQSYNSDLNLNYASTDVDDIVNSVAGSATLDNFVHMTGNETVNGIKSFPDGIVANVTGSATSATNDGSGNVISSTYGKLGAVNEWSGDNTFSATINYKTNHSLGNLPQDSDTQIALKIIDTAGTNYLGQVSSYQNTTSTGLRFTVRDKFDSNGLFSQNGENRNKYLLFLQNEENRGYLQWDGFVNNGLYPLVSNNANLGSTILQWNNICAKDYYYNGTKWGLDQSNQWTKNQIISSSTGGNCFIIKTLNAEMGEETPETSKMFGSFLFEDKNSANVGGIGITHFSNGEFLCRWLVRYKFTNGAKSTTGTEVPSAVDLGLSNSGESFFRPYYTNTTDLGTSGRKWKTFNGVNPGSLSLPDTLGVSGTENVNYFNVIGYLNNTGTPATIPSTATYDGWLYINAKDGAGSYITVDDNPSSFGTSVYGNNGLGSQSVGLLCLICPIRAGHSYSVRIKSDGIVNARIYPAQGNV